jgi:hypothetical protein
MAKQNWHTRKTTADALVGIIGDYLNDEGQYDDGEMRKIADSLSYAFEFSKKQRRKFIEKAVAQSANW